VVLSLGLDDGLEVGLDVGLELDEVPVLAQPTAENTRADATARAIDDDVRNISVTFLSIAST
jgi:hypothetical protein